MKFRLVEDSFKQFKKKEFNFIDYLKSKLGLSYYTQLTTADGEHFIITINFPSKGEMDTLYTSIAPKIKNLGGKYIVKDGGWTTPAGHIRFTVPQNIQQKIENDFNAVENEKEAAYKNSISNIDISKYIPSNKILDKLREYRDKGSHINVKAIKDENKVLIYLCGALILDMTDDKNALVEKAKSMGISKDLINAIIEYTDSQEFDDRSNIEKSKNLAKSNLFTFDDSHCWLPKPLFDFFIQNNIPVHFKGRKNGSRYDSNGVQWTEIEQLELFPGTNKSFNIEIPVHTLESGGRTTYSAPALGTDLRVGINVVIDAIRWALRNKGLL